MDERELIQLYLQQQKPPILDDVMSDESVFVSTADAEQCGTGKVIYIPGGKFSIANGKDKL